jgi:DNA-binding response OmpR family regulator
VTAQRTILIVDDEQDLTDVLRRHLRAAGYRVEVVHDGRSALERIEHEAPDLVILEVVLPGLNGFQVCRAVRRIHDARSLPVLMLTGKYEPADRFWGLEVGASAYLTKPFEVQNLLATLAELLEEEPWR